MFVIIINKFEHNITSVLLETRMVSSVTLYHKQNKHT